MIYISPVPLRDIERVKGVKLLGVYFSDTLRFDEHIKYILNICGQRLYLLKTLRVQGLSRDHLNCFSVTNFVKALVCSSCIGWFSNAASD